MWLLGRVMTVEATVKPTSLACAILVATLVASDFCAPTSADAQIFRRPGGVLDRMRDRRIDRQIDRAEAEIEAVERQMQGIVDDLKAGLISPELAIEALERLGRAVDPAFAPSIRQLQRDIASLPAMPPPAARPRPRSPLDDLNYARPRYDSPGYSSPQLDPPPGRFPEDDRRNRPEPIGPGEPIPPSELIPPGEPVPSFEFNPPPVSGRPQYPDEPVYRSRPDMPEPEPVPAPPAVVDTPTAPRANPPQPTTPTPDRPEVTQPESDGPSFPTLPVEPASRPAPPRAERGVNGEPPIVPTAALPAWPGVRR